MIDLTGKRFGRLVVLRLGKKPPLVKGSSPAYWRCQCDCGGETTAASSNLRGGSVASCGCLRTEMSSLRLINKAPPANDSIISAISRAYKQGAKDRGHSFELSIQELRALVVSNCTYCGAPPSRLVTVHARTKSGQGDLRTNGIDRKDNDLGYTTANTVACCTICNNAKKNLSMVDWLAYLKRLTDFRRSA